MRAEEPAPVIEAAPSDDAGASIAGWTLLGTGAAALIAGVVLLALARLGER